MMGGNTTSG
jgi:hypothetical protein